MRGRKSYMRFAAIGVAVALFAAIGAAIVLFASGMSQSPADSPPTVRAGDQGG